MVNESAIAPSPSDRRQELERLGCTLFVTPPLVRGEDGADYHDISVRLYKLAKPEDVVEEIYVNDVVYHTFNLDRLRKYRAELITAGELVELVKYLEPSKGKPRALELARKWYAGDSQEVDSLLAELGVTTDEIAARSYAGIVAFMEHFDRSIAKSEAQRNAALRELERHRSSFAPALRGGSDEIVDAEFEHVGEKGCPTQAKEVRPIRKEIRTRMPSNQRSVRRAMGMEM